VATFLLVMLETNMRECRLFIEIVLDKQLVFSLHNDICVRYISTFVVIERLLPKDGFHICVQLRKTFGDIRATRDIL